MIMIGKVLSFLFGIIVDFHVGKFYRLSKKINKFGGSVPEDLMRKLMTTAFHLVVWDRSFIQRNHPVIFHIYLNAVNEGGCIFAVLTNGFTREQYNSKAFLEAREINTKRILEVTRDIVENGEKNKLYFIFYPEINEYISFSNEYVSIAKAISSMTDCREEIQDILIYAGFQVPEFESVLREETVFGT